MQVDIGRMTRRRGPKDDYAILKPALPETDYLEGARSPEVQVHRLSRASQPASAGGGRTAGFAREHGIELGAPIAFPYGSTPTKVKLAEAEQLIAAGATASTWWPMSAGSRIAAMTSTRRSARSTSGSATRRDQRQVIIEVGYLTDDGGRHCNQDGDRGRGGLCEDRNRRGSSGFPNATRSTDAQHTP